ncbi:LEAF RUST 10 DISEASE-RESISTANCE LOCUS RECEPTOR-LIKE PROTEIN KINASE-like 1.2 isoform X2 [Benincasa hispida]|uniref:LEAF RUST 10 DISEASE-RESISTANCE LOCUS RECEPTOR-LIKE PROTEIN KINASE-like 1.2 isoform X2 n=1 Tax=Benincasa hispida TaxID=102211 RepID=UPI0019004FC4|nr:LEAF RUST 10 DISEASE-RESISTANCE LOCUS RECEPTOR-LIKE PROTEIN KINASE-like 1.2 isoform X2 [Benincasa hispida]
MDFKRTPFLIIIFFIIFTRQTLSLDQKFEACAPKSCGKGPNISYPFWIAHLHGPFCGFPSLDIACKDENPVIRISNDDYIIREISYQNHSFLLTNAAVYNVNCPTPLHNFSLHRTPFTYSSDHIGFFFFYNCTSLPPNYSYPIDCSSTSKLHSFAAFHDGFLEFMNFSSNSCQSSVEVPVDVSNEDDDFSGLLRKSYSGVLKMGFSLNWNAQNCSNCETSGGRCGFERNQFVCFCPDGPHLKTCQEGESKKWKKAVIGVCIGIGGMLLMSVAFFIWFCLHKKKLARSYTPSSFLLRNISCEPSTKELEKGENDMGLPLFSYEELEKATDRFNPAKELGDGGFGTVYYGKLPDGREVAVKRLFENNYRRVEHFMNEVEILTRLRHPHLVTLYGCTSRHCRELLLVYEFIPNGTVADHLHGNRAKPGELPWHTRLKIAIDTASALAFLHASETIHRDVKTTNILLDNNYNVKVADFGLSRLFPTQATHVSTAPQGTPGYVDPEYHECYQLTNKSDVFSFGVVLVELISSKPAVDITRHRHEINLWTMAINKIRNDELHDFVDSSLGFETDETVRDMICAVAELAFRCLQSVKDTRPSMLEALEILKNIESRSSGRGKEDIDISGEDDMLLKDGLVPESPDSVVVPWMSKSSTPNGSG